MKRCWPALALVCLIVCGCASTSVYSTVVQIEAAKEPGQYLVRATVKEDRSAWYCRHLYPAIQSPVLTCKAGERARAPLDVLARNDGIFIEACIATQGGDENTTCSVTLRRRGKILTSTRVLVPPLAPAKAAP